MPAGGQRGSDTLTIDPIAEEKGHRDVAHETALARLGEKCVELLHQRPTGLRRKPRVAPERRHPPAMHLTTFWTNFDGLPGQLFYPAQDRPRAHHVPEGNVLDKALGSSWRGTCGCWTRASRLEANTSDSVLSW